MTENQERAASLVHKARNKLMMDFVFEGTLLQKLQVVEDRRHASIYTDARVIGYNADWVAAQTYDDLCFWLLSCVAHCELGHPWRRGNREQELWDEAADHVGHLCLLRDPRVRLPQGALADPEFLNWSTFEVYDELLRRRPPPPPPQQSSGGAPDEQKQQGDDKQESSGGESEPQENEDESESKGEGDEQAEGDSEGDPASEGGSNDSKPQHDDPPAGDEDRNNDGASGGDSPDEQERELSGSGRPGECLDAGASGLACDEDHPAAEDSSEASKQRELEEWAEAGMVAHLSCGDEDGALFRRASQDRTETRGFMEYLERFVNTKLRDEATWSVGNRRFISSGLYLPGYRSDNSQAMVIGIDVSGSIGQEELDFFQEATRRVQQDFRIKQTIVLYCDTQVRLEERFSEHEPVTFAAKIPGGGGTKFAPVFERCEELRAEGLEIAGVVYLTDLFGKVAKPERFAASIETLWVSSLKVPVKALFEQFPDYKPKFGDVCSLFH